LAVLLNWKDKKVMKFKVSAEKERAFQKQQILSLKDQYLGTNTINKYENDLGYKAKIDHIKLFLDKYKTDGYILDIGSNTSGESEILFHQGHKMVPNDINEIALSFSKIRSKKFRNEEMNYFAMDAHNIPFEKNVFDKVVAIEMLHHMENIKVALSGMFNTLKEGGYLFTLEPYAYNPYRRLSEIRDYFRGTIEKSFSVRKLTKLFIDAGFEIVETKKIVIPVSSEKVRTSGRIRQLLKKLYSYVSEKFPSIFGYIYLVVRKPGKLNPENINLYDNLKCPFTGNKLFEENGYYITKNIQDEILYRYPIYNGIPVLIKEDALVKDKV